MTIAASTQLISFLVLSAVIVLGALGVVLLSNIVYSAFLLGGVFLAVAGLYLLLNASFVAAAQVLVYVGAVNVLILFAIMLVNKKEDLAPIPGLPIRRLLSGGVCVGLFALLTVWLLPLPGPRAQCRLGRKQPSELVSTCLPITCCLLSWHLFYC